MNHKEFLSTSLKIAHGEGLFMQNDLVKYPKKAFAKKLKSKISVVIDSLKNAIR